MQFFLKWSTLWAKSHCLYFFWICFYIILSLGLIGLIYLQHVAFLSNNDPQFSQNDIYLKSKPNLIWTILNIIEFIWGFQFLKDSCNLLNYLVNFLISGSSTQYYLQKDNQNSCCLSFTRMIKFHFGSVIGGSFFNAFFNIIKFFF